MDEVAGGLQNLVPRRCIDVPRDSWRKAARERRYVLLDHVLAELQRPRLVWDLAVRGVNHETGAGLLPKGRTMLLDILGRHRSFPVTLEVRLAIGSARGIEGLQLLDRARVELGRRGGTSAGGPRRRLLGCCKRRRYGERQDTCAESMEKLRLH